MLVTGESFNLYVAIARRRYFVDCSVTATFLGDGVAELNMTPALFMVGTLLIELQRVEDLSIVYTT